MDLFKLFNFKRKRQIKASDYGRKDGWLIELDGKIIAELINPKFEEMFWYSYELKVLNTSFRDAMFDQIFWDNPELKFFSKALNEYSSRAPIVAFDRIEVLLIRGLYIEN